MECSDLYILVCHVLFKQKIELYNYDLYTINDGILGQELRSDSEW